MDRLSRAPLIVIGISLTAVSLGFAGQGAKVTAGQLTPDEMETFLLKSRILDTSEAGAGVTGSRRVKKSYGTITHDAHEQTVDIANTMIDAGQNT